MRQSALIRFLAILPGLAAPLAHAQTPLDTSFTYQGQLSFSGTPASGQYDLRFTLFDATTDGNQIGTTLCSDNVSITDGSFAVSLDFGAAFAGQKRYLQVQVRADTGLGCQDAAGYTVLSPRQELSATPYASFALSATNALTAGNAASLNGQSAGFYQNAENLTGTLASAQLGGVYNNALTFSNPSNVFAGNGTSIINLNAANISAGVLDAARMPTNWPAGGDLSGFFPAPLIAPGAVTLSKLEPGVQGVLSNLTSLMPAETPLDGIGWGNNSQNRAIVPTPPPGLRYTALSAGHSHSLGLLSDGTMVVWGFSGNGQGVVPTPPAGHTFTAIAAGGYHNLGLCSDGSLLAAGSGTQGQTTVPQLPSGVVYTAVAAGLNHTLALRSDGNVVGFGNSSFGQLAVPSLPPGMTYTAVAAGWYHSMALRSDGNLISWGNSASDLRNVPALPPGTSYIAASGGYEHSLALRSDGVVVAWGNNTHLQINVPALPAGLTYTAVAAGNIFSVALRSDGSVVAWGGDNSILTQVPALPAGVKYTAITAGSTHGLALRVAIAPPSLSSPVGLSIGSTTPPPAQGGISVAGNSSFEAQVSAASFSGSGDGLTNLNASNISSGTLDPARVPNLDASKITTGVFGNARTSGTSANLASTLVLRDASGNFSAGVITAALNGNATNATQLNGQPGSFYTNATNLGSGTLADARLSTNVPRLNVDNTFVGTQQVFSSTRGINILNGVIQKGGTPLAAMTDLGLYSQTSGNWIRFVTNNAQFAWFSDSGSGTTPRMTLSATGNLIVSGNLSKAGGSFKIDHPLDPENKYLYHSFVESPDMMNVYNGNITTDGAGYATITLPDYFEALNRDFRYQLTVVDEQSFAMVRVSRKIAGNTFQIASSQPGVEVSWQVTGIRKDAWAEKNRIPNAVDKVGAERGKYLHPEAFGKPASEGMSVEPAALESQTHSPRDLP